jgi:hypothetical protein
MVAQTSALPVPVRPLDPLRHWAALQRDLDDFVAVAVRDALDHGADWTDISEVTSISVSSLKNRFSRAQVTRTVRARQKRRPVTPTTVPASVTHPGPPDSEPVDENEEARRRGRHALARALSHLHRVSGSSVRTVAVRTGVSASYAYRIMSGERNPAWKVVRSFALACDGDPNDLVDLWNAVNGHRESGDTDYEVARLRFQGVLRGLHLAEARPTMSVIAARSQVFTPYEMTLVESLLTSARAHQPERLSWRTTVEVGCVSRQVP